jgi:RimJ/RimL family protein N-acetyltransferase
MTDTDFLAAIADATLPPERFDHGAHLRLCWLVLRDDPEPAARIAATIRDYADAVGATGTYDDRITAGWLWLVDRARRRHPDLGFDALVAAEPSLVARLAPPDPAHAALVFRWRAQRSHVRHNPLRPCTMDECAARLARAGHDLADLEARLNGAAGPEELRWLVTVGDAVVGSVSVRAVAPDHRNAELGYGLDEAWHGRGIAASAVRQLVDRVFARTSMHKLYATVDTTNTASIMLCERLGFVREGVLRDHFFFDGRWADEAVYAVYRDGRR